MLLIGILLVGSGSCSVNQSQDFHVGSPVCSCQNLHQDHFPRALLCTVLVAGDQAIFCPALPQAGWSVLLGDFLAVNLQDELFPSCETGRNKRFQSWFC